MPLLDAIERDALIRLFDQPEIEVIPIALDDLKLLVAVARAAAECVDAWKGQQERFYPWESELITALSPLLSEEKDE